MSSKEIKCPHCKQWTLWAGNHYDRCLYCNGFLENERFTKEVEKKSRHAVLVENDPFFVKPTDTNTKKQTKDVLRFLRASISIAQIAFYTFISIVLFILGIVSA